MNAPDIIVGLVLIFLGAFLISLWLARGGGDEIEAYLEGGGT